MHLKGKSDILNVVKMSLCLNKGQELSSEANLLLTLGTT